MSVGRREKSWYVLCTTSCSSEEAARWREARRKEASCVGVSPSPLPPPPSTLSTVTKAHVNSGTMNCRELGGREGDGTLHVSACTTLADYQPDLFK